VIVVGPSPSPPTSADSGTSDTLTSVTDLDSGGQSFLQIAPSSGGSGTQNQEPDTVVAPVTKAPQAQPKVQTTETALGGPGSNIFEAHLTFVQHLGVPGIAQPASMAGNRSLWFATGGP
jgi:hypothetical protein